MLEKLQVGAYLTYLHCDTGAIVLALTGVFDCLDLSSMGDYSPKNNDGFLQEHSV